MLSGGTKVDSRLETHREGYAIRGFQRLVSRVVIYPNRLMILHDCQLADLAALMIVENRSKSSDQGRIAQSLQVAVQLD